LHSWSYCPAGSMNIRRIGRRFCY